MYELTNEQRRCFGLPPVEDGWVKVEVTPSIYDLYDTWAYLDGCCIKKVVQFCDDAPGNETYREYSVDAMLSEDGKMLLPKTEKGKPAKFTSATLGKRTPVGMSLSYSRGHVSVVNQTTERSFYSNSYEEHLENIEAFKAWVDAWCAGTGEKQQREIDAFAAETRSHQKYKEGDFFRYRVSRELYGYGRILLDFSQMRKKGIPFWDVFMGKPLCVAVYHIATERDDLTPADLVGLRTLPSHMIMDNAFFYGEFPIIGNLPLTEAEQDYPIHYGKTIRFRESGVRYQCGRTYISLAGEEALCGGFINNDIGWKLNVKLPVLQKCIEDKSNQPYWDLYYPYCTSRDLRNPKNSAMLHRIRHQVGLE